MKVQVRHLIVLVAAIVALMLMSCNDEDTATSFDAGINPENICEEVAESMCYNIFQCCTGKEREELLGEELTLTEGECVDDMILFCERVGAEKLHAVDNETITFDLDAAKACVEALVLPDDAGCVDVELDPAFMDLCFDVSLFSGTVDKDGDCFWDWECEGEAYCGFDFTCRDLPSDGETCNFASEAPSACADNHYCDFATNECTELAGDGDDCTSDFDCTEDLYCDDVDTGASLTCATVLADGEDCTKNAMCESSDCRVGFCDIFIFDSCMEDADCTDDVCEGTNFTCDAQADDCPMFCTGDMATICTVDADCAGAGGTCAKPACLTQTCIDGGICEFESPDEIDYCAAGLVAPCIVFDDFDECGFF